MQTYNGKTEWEIRQEEIKATEENLFTSTTYVHVRKCQVRIDIKEHKPQIYVEIKTNNVYPTQTYGFFMSPTAFLELKDKIEEIEV